MNHVLCMVYFLVVGIIGSQYEFNNGLRLIGHPEDEIIPLFNETGNVASRVVFFDQKIGGIGYLKELSDAREIGDYVKVTPTKFDRVFIIQLLELSVENAFRIIADGNGERLSLVLWISRLNSWIPNIPEIV